jgi:hypothetical protein
LLGRQRRTGLLLADLDPVTQIAARQGLVPDPG